MADLSSLEPALRTRAGDACELCGATDDLAVRAVPPSPTPDADRAILACATCSAQIDGAAPLDATHWLCLHDAVWRDVPAVQVQAWRLLQRLTGASWARDLLDQVYLDDALLAWARDVAAEPAAADAPTRVVDSHGVTLVDGDTVTLIKDLDVKGASFTAKRGTVVKGIRVGDDPEHVEGRVNGIAIYLKTCFLKKVV